MQPLIPLVIDMETFYDEKAGYSLKKMPTAQYVRDPRFAVLGAGVRLADAPAVWLEPDALTSFLAQVPWEQVLLIGHNLQFDALVLTEHYGHRPRQYACTMFMLRWLISQGLLDPRMGTALAEAAALVGMEKGNLEQALANDTLGEYATDDAAICAALYDKYWHTLPEDEQGFIDIHVRMAVEPVFGLDREALRALADADKALEDLFPLVRKDDLFAAALSALGVSPEYKRTDKNNLKLALAKTDKFMLRLQEHPNAQVRLLAETRLRSRSTISRSRAQRFLDVGAPLPAPILYYAAHTGRGGGLDKLNVQNLPRKGGLREAILAPDGYKLVIVDSSQIEVRVNAWLAGQEDLLGDFRQGRDPYLAFAAFRYGQDYDDLVIRYKAGDAEVAKWRQVCKAAVLALGFMQGEGGFEGYCETNRVPLAPGEGGDVVRTYRQKHGAIVRLANRALAEIRETGRQQAPNGTCLTYPDLRITAGGDVEWRRPRIFAKSVNEGWGTIWRGAAIENCLSHQSEVLTCQGWLPLAKVSAQHRVWDGVEWVRHSGFVDQGVRPTLNFGGVWMTPDHQVLTPAGFLPAERTTHGDACGHTERLHRRAPGAYDRCPASGVRWPPNPLARALRLWGGAGGGGGAVRQGRDEDLRGFRVPEQEPADAGDGSLADPRHVATPGVCGVASHARPLPVAYTPSLEKLRGAGDSGLRAVGGVVRRLLGGYGADLPAGAYAGASGQQRRLRADKLPVGGSQGTSPKQAHQRRGRHAAGADVGLRGGGAQRIEPHDAVVPPRGGGACGQHVQPLVLRPVGDLLNAGPRHRFTVRGVDGRPFIVSNCVQKVARDVVFWQALQAHRAGYRLVLMAHDELVFLARDEDAEATLAAALAIMRAPPPWAAGLPLGAEGTISDRYTK